MTVNKIVNRIIHNPQACPQIHNPQAQSSVDCGFLGGGVLHACPQSISPVGVIQDAKKLIRFLSTGYPQVSTTLSTNYVRSKSGGG